MNTKVAIKKLPVSMLKPAKYNPRKDLKPGDPAYEKIKRSLHDFGYNELMKNGWRMKEINEMDMLGFLRLRAWDAQREQEKKKPRQSFIDEVWPGVKP